MIITREHHAVWCVDLSMWSKMSNRTLITEIKILLKSTADQIWTQLFIKVD